MGTTSVVTGNARALVRPSVWSNLFFLAPLILSVRHEIFVATVACVALFLSSTLYHSLSEKNSGALLWNDRFFALVLTLVNAGLIVFGEFTFPYFQVVVVLTFVALYFYERQYSNASVLDAHYEWHHATWHFITALITTLSIITFYV